MTGSQLAAVGLVLGLCLLAVVLVDHGLDRPRVRCGRHRLPHVSTVAAPIIVAAGLALGITALLT